MLLTLITKYSSVLQVIAVQQTNQHLTKTTFAIAQAVVEVRAEQGTTGPLFLGKDTHALSEPAFSTVIEVLVANGVEVIIQEKMVLLQHQVSRTRFFTHKS